MTAHPPRIVSTGWLAAHIDEPNVVTVDVRPEDHYHVAHIPGARNVDIYPMKILDSAPEAVNRWVDAMQGVFRNLGIDHDDHVVFYEDISGTSAARSVWLMEALSIGHGSMLDGGLAAWHSEGRELSNQSVDVTPSSIELSLNSAAFATAPDILGELSGGSDSATILDTRSQLEYMQATIPGSPHLEWTAHLDASGKFRQMEQLRELYRDLLPQQNDSVITFCASGYRAAHTWLVLSELGYANVRNYAPSWGEWGRRDDLPKTQPER